MLSSGPKVFTNLLDILHQDLKNKERKLDFRFVERKLLPAITQTGSAERTLVPVLLCITSHEERTARFTAQHLSALVAVWSSVADMSSHLVANNERSSFHQWNCVVIVSSVIILTREGINVVDFRLRLAFRSRQLEPNTNANWTIRWHREMTRKYLQVSSLCILFVQCFVALFFVL